MKLFILSIVIFISIYSFSQDSVLLNNKKIQAIRVKPELPKDTLSLKFHLQRANSYMNRGEFNSALYCLKRAEAISPEYIDIYINRTDIYKGLELLDSVANNQKKTIELYENGYPLNKSPLSIYTSYATYCLKNQNYIEAEAYFSKALLYEHSASAIYNRGVARLYLNKLNESCSDIRLAKEQGVKQADKILSTWCKSCDSISTYPEVIKVDEEQFNMYFPGLDTVFARISYTSEWDISDSRNRYYRECKWIKSLQQFEGHFVDYSGNKRYAEGTYVNGQKHGLYKKYQINGTLECVGNFQNDKPFGTWQYYYPNKQRMMTLFFKDDNFTVLEYYDENGKQLLKDGNGTWEYSFRNSRNYLYTLKGAYKDYKRVGKWTLECNTCMQSVVEKYSKKGEYVNTKTSMWQHMEKSNQMFFTSWIMTELRHDIIKKKRYSSPEIFSTYPYFIESEMTKSLHEDVF